MEVAPSHGYPVSSLSWDCFLKSGGKVQSSQSPTGTVLKIANHQDNCGLWLVFIFFLQSASTNQPNKVRSLVRWCSWVAVETPCSPDLRSNDWPQDIFPGVEGRWKRGDWSSRGMGEGLLRRWENMLSWGALDRRSGYSLVKLLKYR